MSHTHYLHVKNDGKNKVVETIGITQEGVRNDKLADYFYIQMMTSHLMGKVLTIVDASFSDPAQRKAVKDLMRDEWATLYQDLSEQMLDLSDVEIPENAEEVTLQEALGA
jgi:alpha-L-arabinofuranosidase